MKTRNFLKRKSSPIIYVVARAAAGSSEWTVWAVPATAAMRILHALEPKHAQTDRARAQELADGLNREQETRP